MTHRKRSISLLVSIFFIIATIGLQSHNQKAESDWTEYYWFDAYGNYLWRQNLIDDEKDLTGYDEFLYSPKTLREKGFGPSSVCGDPPVPINPYLPDRRLYSHP